MRELPTGTVTFVFTDVEGSTRLLRELGAERYAGALGQHRRLLRGAFARHGGVEVDTQGDAFFYAFPTAPAAVAAASEGEEALRGEPIHVRVGIHTGTPLVSEEGYVGHDVHKAARIASAGHGGQVLVSSSTASLVEANGLVDLGEHRLKDLSAPERIYQLGAGDFPPLRTLYRTNLPIPMTPFLGRERELADVTARVNDDGVRLITLTGPGGTGKTRLGLHAAAEAADRFPDGVFWVALARLREPSLVLEEARQALGAQDGLAEEIADKRILLVLDNFEHLLAAADDLAAVLSSCPRLCVLVTSRALLQLPGEHAYPVPPLAPSESIELFVARGEAVKPGFRATGAVAELCERLDHLPLAIELAAARVRMLSPEQLLERLSNQLDLLKGGRGVDPRQQTLRATIEWSHELLDQDEKRLFAHLSVFRGGCTLEAAEEVAGAELDVLQSLVDKSLVRVRDGERFWMLESIRAYAAEQLAAFAGRDQLHLVHARFSLTLAEEAEPHLWSNPGVWLDRLDADVDNLRAALDFFEDSDDTQSALSLAGALARFWMMRGNVGEGLQRLERLLQRDDAPTAARAKALTGAAVAAANSGAHELASRRANEARCLCEQLGDPRGAAYATHMLGFSAGNQNEYAAALAYFVEAERVFEELGETHGALLSADGIAWAVGNLGDDERRRNLHEQILRRAQEAGDKRIEALTLGQLASFAFEDGRLADALALMGAQYAMHRDQGDRRSFGEDLCRLGSILAEVKQYEAAAHAAAHSQLLCERAGGTGSRWVDDQNAETLEAARRSLGEAAFRDAVARGRRSSTDDAVELAVRVLSADNASR